MQKPVIALLVAIPVALTLGGLTLGALTLRRALIPARSDRPLTISEASSVHDALALMRRRGLTDDATFGDTLFAQGRWRAASSTDAYLAGAERAGDTPYAYTLADGKTVLAVVLAPRFFTDITPTARAAVMIHEMGHCRAYQATGHSTEYDGYKREYDTHRQLGLTEQDSLVYWSMLDGVAEYVVPRTPAYKNYSDVKAYLAQPGGS